MAGLLKPLEDFHANNKGLIWLAGGVVSGGGSLWKYLAGDANRAWLEPQQRYLSLLHRHPLNPRHVVVRN